MFWGTHALAVTHSGARLHCTFSGPSPADVAFVTEALQKRGGPTIPNNFVQTAPAYNPQSKAKRGNMPRVDLQNPQTIALLDMLGLRWVQWLASDTTLWLSMLCSIMLSGQQVVLFRKPAVHADAGVGTSSSDSAGLLCLQHARFQ